MKNNEIPLLPGRMYHIYNHANGKEMLFSKRENQLFFLAKYALHIEPVAKTFAYCLMSNHIHFAVQTKDLEALTNAYCEKYTDRVIAANFVLGDKEAAAFVSRSFGNLFSSYTQAYNKQQSRIGSLFIPNFKRKEIETPGYLGNVIHYIHSNPVHHGFAKKMMDWEFSSIHGYWMEKQTRLAKEKGLEAFEGIERFKAQHQRESPFLIEFEF